MTNEVKWMRRALTLAKKGWGKTSPNPMVGAVLVKNNVIVGKGWHKKAGEVHAEIDAIQNAGVHAADSTLYVSLEPCSTRGKTPPCTNAIIEAKIKKVVISTLDPNPSHRGGAVKLLKDEGIEVVVGVEDDKGQQLNEDFFCWIQHKRPYVLLKMAMTLDGKIATKGGNSQWISSKASRTKVQHMRQRADAIMVGAETIRQDDPQLCVRQPENWQNQPRKIIVSKSRNIDPAACVFSDKNTPVDIVCCKSAADWEEYFKKLGNENVMLLMVEGGGELAGQMLHYNLIDKVAIFVAPKLLGGKDSRTVIGGFNPDSLTEARGINDMKITRSGCDYLITGYLTDVHRMH